MILSHKNKFIFLKTKKTASTSIELLLSKVCGKNDIITPVSELTLLGNIRRFEKVTEEDLRKKINAKLPQNYKGTFFFEVAFLIKQLSRFYFNKYISIISSGTKNKVFKKKRRFKYDQHMEISELKKYISNDIYNNYYKFAVVRNPYDQIISDFYDQTIRPEHIKYNSFDEYLDKRAEYFFYKNKRKFTIKGKVVIDSVIKYENLENDLRKIFKKLKIKNKKILKDLKKIKIHGGLRKNLITKESLTIKQKKKIKKAAKFFFKNFYSKIR
tara:strand:+ start:622 stop:1431 length:810 start_codon:yes stop_codon:yes gene_type:complete